MYCLMTLLGLAVFKISAVFNNVCCLVGIMAVAPTKYFI